MRFLLDTLDAFFKILYLGNIKGFHFFGKIIIGIQFNQIGK